MFSFLPLTSRPRSFFLLLAGMFGMCLSSIAKTSAPLIPQGSRMAESEPNSQRILLNPLERGGVISKGYYHLDGVTAEPDPDLEAKIGNVALRFAGVADIGGAKGDYVLSQSPSGNIHWLGAWVYLAPEANVKSLGFQLGDSEGEWLFNLIPADWEGWRWVEVNLTEDKFKQSYPQQGKNEIVDMPLRNINFVWFTQEPGPSALGVDGLTAIGEPAAGQPPLNVEVVHSAWGEAGQSFEGFILLTNFTNTVQHVSLEYSLQRNSQFDDTTPPDPILGSNHALGCPTWLEIKGERIEESTLTDGDEQTAFSSEYSTDAYEEGYQYVDLKQERNVSGLGWRAGDANWIFQVDIAASIDGINYQPVSGLQGLDFYKKWGRQSVDVPAPFTARYLKFRYHNDGKKMNVIRPPGEIYIYDGVADEKMELPNLGEKLDAKSLEVTVAPHDFSLVPIQGTLPLTPSAYLLGVRASGPIATKMALSNYYVMPEEIAIAPSSRFGMNSGSTKHLEMLKRLGVGWIRFENLKWLFYSPAPDEFYFDGSVKPWQVPADRYMEEYREAGFSVLPYLFQTPEWATSAPADVKQNRKGYPPNDYADYGKSVFEVVARYGATTHPDAALKAHDPKSGLNLVNTYEIWNEPNLNAPAWGFWVGSLDTFLELYRVGAEAVKRADPTAAVTSPGWAGLSMEWIDKMRTYTYADGKTPLEFTDILNVHYYSGRHDPEIATIDPNASRNVPMSTDYPTYEVMLKTLSEWRDDLKPNMPIWLTETGYDVGGPIGRSERYQAAKLPRVLMIALANGVEKIFVYRETGSKPVQHGGAGVMRDDASVRPAFFTMATLIRQLEGVTDVNVPRLKTNNSELWMYLWKRPHDTVLTVWTPEGTTPLGLNLGLCRVTDAFGGESEQDVQSDFEVGIFPQYITQITNKEPLRKLYQEASDREFKRIKNRNKAKTANAYLFDFGSTEFVDTKDFGGIRAYTPVLVANIYTAELGYGFSPGVVGIDEVRRWINEALEKDNVLLRVESEFIMDVAAGTYDLEFGGADFREGSEIVITTENNIQRFAIDGKSARVNTQVTLRSDSQVEIIFPKAGKIQWLSLVETVQSF